MMPFFPYEIAFWNKSVLLFLLFSVRDQLYGTYRAGNFYIIGIHWKVIKLSYSCFASPYPFQSPDFYFR